MNIIVLDTPRGNVTKRFRHIHPFYPPLRAPTNANPLLLAIEAVSELNSYLLLLINALKGPQKEPERIRPPLHTPLKPAVGGLN